MPLSMLLPKGRLQDKVLTLLSRVGVRFTFGSRSYRPTCSDPDITAKILKPQNIGSLVALGRHDIGFVGRDWMEELNLVGAESDLVEVLDLGFDPVRIVAAVPEALLESYAQGRIVVASEYERLAKAYIEEKKLNAVVVKTFGATEALPPEDADMIIDNTSTGSTLAGNRLAIVDELMRSTTRLVAHRAVLDDPAKRGKLDCLVTLIRSAQEADRRVLLEMNVSKSDLDSLVAELPCMRAPTVSPLFGEEGYAVKAAVAAAEVPRLIPMLTELGARDILEYRLEKIVP